MKHATPDPHLRAALRHAPDAELQAPPHLSAQIIAAAHRAASQPAPAQPAAGRRWWPAWGVWRLGASGALASMLLAGVIGWIWQTAPPGPALDEAPAAADGAAAPAPVSAAAPAPGAVAPTAGATPAAPPAPRRAAAPRPAAAERVPAPTPAEAPALKPAPAAKSTPSSARAAEPAEAARPAAAAPPAVVLAPAPPPAPTPPVTPPIAPPTAQASPSADAPPAAAAAAPVRPPALTDAAAKRPSLAATLSAPTTPWAGLEPALPRLTWQINGQTLPPDTAWLQTLARHTAGRWQASDETPAAAAEVQVLWLRDGAVVGRLRLRSAGVLWCDAQRACQTAPLPPNTAAELAAALKEKRPR